MKHPLLNKDSKHYHADGEKPAIQELEEILTIEEAIGFATGNAFKYNYRMKQRGYTDSDKKKRDTFVKYLGFLHELEAGVRLSPNKELKDASLSEIYKHLTIDIDYKL
jgi:hypothetical protein